MAFKIFSTPSKYEYNTKDDVDIIAPLLPLFPFFEGGEGGATDMSTQGLSQI